MLTSQKRQRPAWSNLKVLVNYSRAAEKPFKGKKLRPSQIAFLGVVMLECTRTNDFCKYSKAVVLLGKNVIGWTGINELIEIGLLKIPITGFYVVTPEGEYFLRSIETNLSRIVHDLPLSKWKKINAENDLRLKFVRGNQKPNTV